MTDRKQCVKCGRAIDAYARICPYCNWDQTEPVPAAVPVQESALPPYVPPADNRLRNRILTIAGGAVLLIAAFVIGLFVHGRNPPPTPEETATAAAQETAPGKPSPRANVTLVPFNESMPDIEQPITSAPAPNQAQGVPTEYQRTDATAVSSAEYAQMAERAKAEKKQNAALVDPRSITTPAYEQQQQQTPPPQMSSASAPPSEERENFPSAPARIVVTTRPVPTYQPLPDIRVSEPATARLRLLVGKDGFVKEVNVLQGIPGETGKLIGSVQRWRFKPATQNGEPVEAPFTVDVSFNPHE